jgi:hypothetical protein
MQQDTPFESRDRFECWLMEVDEALSSFVRTLPPDVAGRLDFSPASLPALEAWLLSRYPSVGHDPRQQPPHRSG